MQKLCNKLCNTFGRDYRTFAVLPLAFSPLPWLLLILAIRALLRRQGRQLFRTAPLRLPPSLLAFLLLDFSLHPLQNLLSLREALLQPQRLA